MISQSVIKKIYSDESKENFAMIFSGFVLVAVVSWGIISLPETEKDKVLYILAYIICGAMLLYSIKHCIRQYRLLRDYKAFKSNKLNSFDFNIESSKSDIWHGHDGFEKMYTVQFLDETGKVSDKEFILSVSEWDELSEYKNNAKMVKLGKDYFAIYNDKYVKTAEVISA